MTDPNDDDNVTPTVPATPEGQETTMQTRRYKNAGEASEEVYESYNEVTGLFGKYAVEICYALIGANWAVHGTSHGILDNEYAKWSVAAALIFLGMNLILAGAHAFCLGTIVDDSTDEESWKEAFQAAEKEWPYTKNIEDIGLARTILRFVCPLIGTILFIASIL